MATTHNDDDDVNKRSEGEKRCFDLFATLLFAYGNDETRARREQEEQERNMLMIRTITRAAANTFLLGKRKIDDHDECKNQENTASSSDSSSRSLVESKRRRRVVVSNVEEPIRAEPIREIKPPVRERKGPVKRKEPVGGEPVETPEWVYKLMETNNGDGKAKMIFEKALTMTDLAPNQARLLMPFLQIADKNFLTEAERKILKEHQEAKKHAKKKGVDDDKKPKGVDVVLLNRNGIKWNLNMRIWEMRSTFNYALCTGWNDLVRKNDLQINQTITLWSFHSRDGKLYFAFDLSNQDHEAMALALVPVNPASSSEDPFECEEASRRFYQFITRRRTPRVCVQIITNDSGYLEGGLDLNRTPPPDLDLEDVQETHVRSSTSQESLTETSLASWRFLEEGETAVLYET
ncbi:B3 domain-containing protein [Raphanus sativus]|uniref:B3 domain-containing protein At2g31720 n=1 Tax=Raphanus sativus TaxID=3726 RepID=A0A6J0N5U4_RAPSA|nr:B3 domain-containing protein At2g31720 [Raphanus sativus]KAJ4903354.1 B3 domain-containing protein [Raphanus sativus]